MAVVDHVCCSQTATQRTREPEAVDRKQFGQSFTQASRGMGPVLFQPFGVLLQLRHAIIGVEFPGRFEGRLCLVVLLLWKVTEHVSQLVIAAALYRLVLSKDLIDRFSQGFRSIDHEQTSGEGVQAAGGDVF